MYRPTPSIDRQPTESGATFVLDRVGRLDPHCLECAVRRVLESVGQVPSDGAASPGGVPSFTHLDLGRLRPARRSEVLEAWGWIVARCLERGSGGPLFVAYVNAGAGTDGRLLVAGRRPAVVSLEICGHLAEMLLERCAEGRRAP